MEVVGESDSVEEAANEIKATVVEKISASEICDSSRVDDIIDAVMEKINEFFIIEDSESGEEYDGSGYPIKGKYVLINTNRNIREDLNFQTYLEAIGYLYRVAEKEHEWLALFNKDISVSQVVDEYDILNTKTGETYLIVE